MRGVCMEEKKRTVTKVTSGKKPATETAEEVKATGKKVEGMTKAEEKSKAITLRIVSAILWVLAIGCEVLAMLVILRAFRMPGAEKMRIWWIIIFLVADAILHLLAHHRHGQKQTHAVVLYLREHFLTDDFL